MKIRNLVNILKNTIYNSVRVYKRNNQIIFFYDNNKSISLISNFFHIRYTFIDNHDYVSFGKIHFYNFINYIFMLLIINKQFNIKQIEKDKDKLDYKKEKP